MPAVPDDGSDVYLVTPHRDEAMHWALTHLVMPGRIVHLSSVVNAQAVPVNAHVRLYWPPSVGKESLKLDILGALEERNIPIVGCS